MDYYNLDIKEVFKKLNSNKNGLTGKESTNRLKKYGENKLKEAKRVSVLQLFFNQFKGFLVLILIAAAIISATIGEFIDSIVILIILIVNAFLGMFQEYKAERAIEALKKLGAQEANVIRDGKQKRILAKDLVPGDVILLTAGDKVPADARLISIVDLHTDESSLTGESTAVSKELKVLKDMNIADQTNMVFSSTNITRGKGTAIVVNTGMGTEIGKIAKLVEEVEEVKTPLQKKLAGVGKFIGVAVLIVCALVFFVGILSGLDAIDMFLVAISLAVAAVPEGLPAIITVSLALGVQSMMKSNVLVRKLPAVETLGSTTIIASDKTGTLTHGKMTVREIYYSGDLINVTGEGYDSKGKFLLKNKDYDSKKLDLLLKISANCNDANLDGKIGDPTELALLVMSNKGNVKGGTKRIDEVPFSSEQKYMMTFHKEGTYAKGAPEIILDKCKYVLINGRRRVLTSTERKKILRENNRMANGALRVLAMAHSEEKTKKNLTFVGLAGMIDPPREEVKGAIKRCRKAGIKVLMITGDHKLTAQAIGKEIGLTGKVVTGKELSRLADSQIRKVSIFARVNPEHKVKILQAYEKMHVIAMTGDGVNDAPALKKADIGIAMGINGTDVAKEASKMVLTDDNFSSIVDAVEEGRGIYDNIRKFIGYLLSSNFAEVLVIFLGITLGLGLPLIAIQILWMNLVTDGLPALALSKEPIDKNVMNRKPRKKDASIIDKGMAFNMIFLAFIMTAGTLVMFHFFGRTVAFTTLVMFQMFNVLNYKSDNSLFYNLFNNKWLLYAIVSSILLQVIVIYSPLNVFFGVEPISALHWGIIILVSLTVLLFGEIRKVFFPLNSYSYTLDAQSVYDANHITKEGERK